MVLNTLKTGSFEVDGVNMDVYKMKITTRPDDFIAFIEFDDVLSPFTNNPTESNKGLVKNQPLTINVINLASNDEDKETNRQGLFSALFNGFHDFRFYFRPDVIYRGRVNSAPKSSKFQARTVTYETYDIDLMCKPYKYMAELELLTVTSNVPFNFTNNSFIESEPVILLSGVNGSPSINIIVDGESYLFTTVTNLQNINIILDCAKKLVYSTDLNGLPTRYNYVCNKGFPRLTHGNHTINIIASVDEIKFNGNKAVL